MAAQLLAGKGFEVLNLSGGIKAWHNQVAVGDETVGLSLFSGHESVQDVLLVAYSLEQGLEDFYLSMANSVEQQKAKDLFLQLSSIEAIHRDNILQQYQQISGSKIDHSTITAQLSTGALEGGLSTEEYLQLFHPDLNSTTDIIGLAMSIEAQALDLYERASQKMKGQAAEKGLKKITSEEKAHLKQLGKLLDSLL